MELTHTTESEIARLLYTDTTDHYRMFHINNKQVVEQSVPRYKMRIYNTRSVAKFVESVRIIIWSDA